MRKRAWRTLVFRFTFPLLKDLLCRGLPRDVPLPLIFLNLPVPTAAEVFEVSLLVNFRNRGLCFSPSWVWSYTVQEPSAYN
jgi:hypothetical protein